MPTIKKIREHNGDNYRVGQWLACGTAKATALLATGAWVPAMIGALHVDIRPREPAPDAQEPAEKAFEPERNKMLEPEEDK